MSSNVAGRILHKSLDDFERNAEALIDEYAADPGDTRVVAVLSDAVRLSREFADRVVNRLALTWTSEPPTESGKFWVRYYDDSIQMEVDDVVDVQGIRVPPDAPGVFTYFVNDRPLAECEEFHGALWAGPIRLPEPAQEEQ